MEIRTSQEKFPVWFLFVLAVVLFLQYPYVDEFPAFTHAWAQADRYALALGFLHNHFDFFHPQTYNMNQQFPGWFNIPNDQSITAVDFPVVEYVVALLMKVTGHTDPWCFRFIMLIISCTGIYFVYKLSLLYLEKGWKAACVSIGVAASPVYVFYQAGYLPCVSAIAFVWTGLYFYLRGEKEPRHLPARNHTQAGRFHFYKAILFLTLAALIRTPATIFLITITCNEVLNLFLKRDKINWFARPKLHAGVLKAVAIVLAFLAIATYALYNAYLRRVYGSIFLAEPVPAKNWEKAKEILIDVYHNWRLQYFSIGHYVIFFFILCIVTFLLATRKVQVKAFTDPLFRIAVISFTGALLYGILMLKQFVHHDYYFIDTFLTPVFLLFLFLLSKIPHVKRMAWVGYMVILCSILLVLKDAYAIQHTRRKNWDKTDQVRVDFYDSATFLDSLNIGHEAKIMVLDAGAPNLAFILMDRKGYAIINTSPSILESVLTWDTDAVVIQNSCMSELLGMYPALLLEWKCVGDNGKISVFKRYNYIAGSEEN